MRMFTVATGVLLGFLGAAYGQNTAKCPPVKAKNTQEAVMMEQSSNKKGCWVRSQSTGQLIFVSDTKPKNNYKPLLGRAHVSPMRTGNHFSIVREDGEEVVSRKDGDFNKMWSSMQAGRYVARIFYLWAQDVPELYYERPFTITAGKDTEVAVPSQYISIECSPDLPSGFGAWVLTPAGKKVTSGNCGQGWELPPGSYKIQFANWSTPYGRRVDVELKVGQQLKVPAPAR